ncbi:hypothetical protein Bca52824_094750 [Brassica carinata]|uniref:RRM domain-containing protein n=1 Tax=Brassica carinata TaxID=52824 RepID=A0A8X7TIW5_BRACI|nr:hypothetical protein Bca52824_094750 [Brassica carinata]
MVGGVRLMMLAVVTVVVAVVAAVVMVVTVAWTIQEIQYRVIVSGLPSSASWQDLKDHMRKGGEVCFSQVFRDGRGTTGIVDYTSYEDMKYAIKKLDDTEFRNAFSRGYVRVREYDSRRDSRSPSRGRSYSKSRSRSRSRSRGRSHSRSLSRSRSRSRSPKAKSSRRSPAKSTSRSPRSRSKSRTPPPRGSRSRSRSPLPPPVQKEASKSPSKVSPAKSPMHSRSKSRSRSPSRRKGRVDKTLISEEAERERGRRDPWRNLAASPSYQKTLSSTSSSSSKTILETGLVSHASAPSSPLLYGTSAVKHCAIPPSPPSSPNSSLLPPPLPLLHLRLFLLPAAGLLYKLAVCCPGLFHAGILLENSDFGLERELGPDQSLDPKPKPTDPGQVSKQNGSGLETSSFRSVTEPVGSGVDTSSFQPVSKQAGSEDSVTEQEPTETTEIRPGRGDLPARKRRKISRSLGSHLASGGWNLSREQGNKLLASRFRGDCLYLCNWPGCIHVEEKRNYMLFRGVFKDFKRSRVWRTINDGGGRSKVTGLKCAFCECDETWDMHSSFCLRRVFGFHDDGEPVVRAYVCENGHVSGAWTALPLYT